MKVVDNFLSDNDFVTIRGMVMAPDFPWALVNEIAYPGDHTKQFYMAHYIYNESIVSNWHQPIVEERLKPRMDIKSLMRVKVNLYPSGDKLIEPSPHVDFNFSHKGALYYLNTCDGHTRIEGEKVETIANRMVFFDPGEEHNSTNCTNDKFRLNINFNYF